MISLPGIGQFGLASAAIGFVLLFVMRYYFDRKRRSNRSEDRTTIAFFHPYCNSGGGGEKVLWSGIAALQDKYQDVDIIVYTGDNDATPQQILAKARQRFNVQLQRHVQFVFLNWRRLVEAKTYPVFTLLGQSVGGFILGLEALFKYCPDIFVESTGFAFALPLFRILGKCRTSCYVHYPTISVDMLQLVAERRPTYNNRDTVARNPWLTRLKLIYYKTFAWIYGWAGASAHAVMVNSTWTYNHISVLWGRMNAVIVYPPCDVKEFITRLSNTECESVLDKEIRILTVGQFRPEKDHRKQIEIAASLKLILTSDQWTKLKWIFVGGCRNEEDYALVEGLRILANELDVVEKVEFKINLPFQDLEKELGRALVGVHTMWNEHFGISVVEHMAAGNIIVAHDSGGPKSDIVVPFDGEPVGFLADTVERYAEIIKEIIELTPDQRQNIRNAARAAVCARFSDTQFTDGFTAVIGSVL